MFLVVHTAAGAIIGQLSPNIFWAFVIGFLSHFLLDAIPHGDTRYLGKIKANNEVGKFLTIASIDAILSLFLFAGLYGSGLLTKPLLVFAGVAGAILPDFLVGIAELTRACHCSKLYLCRFHQLHYTLHGHLATKKDLSFIPGLILQIFILFFLLQLFTYF